MPDLPKRPTLHKIDDVLAVVFHAMWILIGIFILLVIYGQIRQGALRSILGPAQSPPQVETPTETVLPGVGTVNIECVQTAISQETIQKIVVDGNTSNLTADEKAKLEPCIVEAASPQASPES